MVYDIIICGWNIELSINETLIVSPLCYNEDVNWMDILIIYFLCSGFELPVDIVAIYGVVKVYLYL